MLDTVTQACIEKGDKCSEGQIVKKSGGGIFSSAKYQCNDTELECE